MHDILLCGPKILGTIDQYVIRYKLQSRGSVHAHIILWMNQNDIERVTNEITAATPTIFDTTTGEFLEPIDSHQNKLFKIVMRKQLHICNSRCQQRSNANNYKYGFPFKLHIEEKTTYNPESKRWEYYRPRYEDRNVVPYHASLLLMWGAHFYLQRINTTYWSYYLLKYAMKCEPQGPINLNKKNAERLGLHGASDA